MLSQRRVRLLCYFGLAAVITLLLFATHLGQIRPPDNRTFGVFYEKKMAAMNNARGRQSVLSAKGASIDHDGDGSISDGDRMLALQMADRLKAAERKAKDNANAKAPNKPDSPAKLIGMKSYVTVRSQDPKDPKKDGLKRSEDEREAKRELNKLLKAEAVIIFSKTFCPHSKRAKHLLLDKYDIHPAPLVYELDVAPYGKQIQDRLADMTGRKTVPNVLVHGKSIGGGDEIAALDAGDKLIEKIKSLGGQSILRIQRRPT